MMIDGGRPRGRGWRFRPGRLLWLSIVGLAAAAALLLAGWGSAGAAAGACPSVNRPNMLKLVAGSQQMAQLEKPFQTSLQVELANSNGCPLSGQLAGVWVDFSAPASGPSGTFATSGTNYVTVGTDATGVATAPTFTANDTAGSYTVQADSDYGSVQLYLTNTASGVPASITAGGTVNQQQSVNGQYGQPLLAQVVDADGRPVQGASVTFSLGTGPTGASASFLGGGAQASATTKSDGQASSPPFVANGTPGRFTATASIAGLAAAVATYTLVNHAAAYAITTTQAAETATVGSRYRRPLRARVLDRSGQPIEGVSVTFTLAQGTSGASASFLDGSTQASELTDAHGQASSPQFTANASPGRFTGGASVAGLSNPVSYALRNLAGELQAATHEQQTATVAHRYRRPLQARLLDAHGRPVEGLSVTFTIGKATSGASASFPDGTSQATATTNAAGRASSPPLLANSTAGRFSATAAVSGSAKSVSYPLRNMAGRPATISAGGASGEATPLGTRFPIPLAVTVTDADNNPIAGVVVLFAAPAGGASGHFGPPARWRRSVRVKTNNKGIAVAPPFTANDQPGGYVATATAAGLHAAFALINQPHR